MMMTDRHAPLHDDPDPTWSLHMTQPGVLDRIATALETIAAALTGETPAPRTPRRPDAENAQFGWEPDTEQPPVAKLPEPKPPVERCGFLIEQYIHPLDRATTIYQISKSGVTDLLAREEVARLDALDDEEFTATMASRLAEVLARRHRETRAAAAEPTDAPPSLPPDVDDEERQREWARTAMASDG